MRNYTVLEETSTCRAVSDWSSIIYTRILLEVLFIWRMTPARLWFFWTAVVLHVASSEAQDEGKCMDKFSLGKEDFVLDVDESVKEGATFLSSPQVSRPEDCVLACCNDPNCNLALIEHGENPKSISSCFIFNCLYKQKKVCRFVRKNGFNNYVLISVFKDYLEQKNSDVEDKHPVAVTGQDRVVQPKEDVVLNGIESKDDKKIVKYEWEKVSGDPSAVMTLADVEDKHPVAVTGQDRVVQPKEDVVLNGIESKDDKKIVKYEWEKVSGDPSAVMTEGPFEDSVTVSNLSPGMYKFRLTVTDAADQTGSAEVSILVLTPEQSLHHCLVPKKEGPCRGSFPRWHYNAVTEKCEQFKFGGCKPNRNNYLALNECLNACDKVSASAKPPSGRLGPIHDHREQCDAACGPDHFSCSSKCCIEKELECDGEPQCSDGSDEAECSKLDSKFRRLLDIPVDKSKGDCSAAIVIAIILGLAIAVLLVVILCCLLKGKKKHRNKHQHVAVNGGHVHSYEDSEKLVYNSTTKPI
ncbi:kunitz-type protease inhibitor 1-like [Sinocyclocheilus grahami]|uniref:kunitz-type protease inhibitor 1-like n=1 Tax=Sinocyclocheilus grahami TaxID=75366 RepID=UPI0007AD25C0|nr:PREDICTED: kunitz-type protease inhibitor 1-like [Sinocyclocheilus grahami]